VLTLAQKIAQLSNMINTYAREIQEGDISSPIVIDLISEKSDRAPVDLKNYNKEIFKELEQNYEQKVENYLSEMIARSKNIKTVDIKQFAGIMERIWQLYKVRNLADYKETRKEIIIVDGGTPNVKDATTQAPPIRFNNH
jgi:hypothetical protein